MKRFFLIPLMTLVCSVMAWGTEEIEVDNFADLKAQLSADGTADVIKLKNDIEYPANGSDILNIGRSLTLDGQGYKITGYGIRQNNPLQTDATYNKTIVAINNGNSAAAKLDVTLKNITLKSLVSATAVGVYVFGDVNSLSIESTTIDLRTSISNAACVALFGTENELLELNIDNSDFYASNNGYPFYILRPVKMEMLNSSTEGYGALNMQPPVTTYKGVLGATGTNRYNQWNGNAGTRGSIIHATNCYFDAPNKHSGSTNQFGVFALKDDGVTIRLTNCGMNAEELGSAKHYVFQVGGWWTPVSRMEVPYYFTIEGDNSHINGEFLDMQMHIGTVPAKEGTGNQFLTEAGARFAVTSPYSFISIDEEEAYHYGCEINFTITGGTYSMNPETYTYGGHLRTDLTEAQKKQDPDQYRAQQDLMDFEGTDYEVKTVNQGGVTVYRVVKKAARDGENKLYDLNDNVQSQGDGQNPTTSFDLYTGEDMTLNQEITKAGYVEVKDHATAGATTVTVGTPTEDQTLVINNGLDVQGNSKVDVQAGSTLVIGEGGIVTSKPENIVIEADRAGAASLIMDPAITVNQTPNLTVRMTAKQIGKTADGEFWHRFAMPVQHANSWDKEGSLGTGNDKYPTYLYGWNYSSDSWYKLPNGVSDMQAFMGYTLRLATEETATDQLQDVVYIFKGQLAGNTNNTLQFSRNGYNFFGNSYTGYIDLKQLVAQITSDSKIEGTAWVWNTDMQRYQDVPLNLLAAGTYDGESDKWKTEIAPMQTFILKQNGSNNASTEINYASAVWGNPRYSAATGVVAAPARRVADMNTTRMYIAVTAANGQSDEVFFVEDANYSDAFDNGYDASKYMNPNTINVFANQNGIDLGTVASDNLNGKTLSLKTNGELAYTMSFKNVEGEEYAIRDNVTGAVINIEEGATYEFAAQPNSTIEGRFEIVAAAKLPTAIENTEVKANVKGIYTIMGQYLGENFDILPAGVYVVDGVKIVK